MLTTSTDILFSSPALNSLKRAQLVQLCKLHDLKTTGKNDDLICRLKRHASILPSDAPLSIAVRSEDSMPNPYGDDSDSDLPNPYDDDDNSNQMSSDDGQRTSQLWQTLEDIAEVSESGHGSRSESTNSKKSLASTGSTGEFGTTSSKSSLFASLASSIGLKRSTSASSVDSTTKNKDKDQKSEKSVSPSKGSKTSNAFSILMGRNRSTSQSDRDSLITHAVPYEAIPASHPSRLPQTDPFTFSIDEPEDEDMSMASIDRPVPGLGPSNSTNAIAAAGSTIRLITSVSKSSELNAPPDLPAIIPSFDLVPPTPGKSEVKCWPMSPSPTRRLYHKLNLNQASEMEEASPTSPTRPTEPFIFGSPNPRHSTTHADFSNAAASVIAEMNARLGATGVRALNTDVFNAVSGPMSPTSVEELLKYEFGAGRTKDAEGAATVVEGSVTSKFDRAHEREFSKMEGIDAHYAAKRGERAKATEPLNIGKKRKSTVLGGGKLPASGPARKRGSSNVRVISTGTRRKAVIPGAFGDEDDDEDEDDAADEEGTRGAKRACVGESRKVSIAPGALKEKEEAEAKKRQSEAVKRQLALNKQRRLSTRAVRPSLGVPKPKPRFGFLTTAAKSIVKSVWNRGGSSKTDVADAAPASRKSVVPTRKESLAKKTSLTGSSTSAPSTGPADRVPLGSAALSPIAPPSDLVPAPAILQKADVAKGSPAPAPAPPTRVRKPTIAPPLPSTANKPMLTRTSRLTAPTASSLAKMNATAQAKANVTTATPANSASSKSGSTTSTKHKPITRATSKIPVISPPKKVPSSSSRTKIFSKPLSLLSSPKAKGTKETGKQINPITGAVSPPPGSPRQPFSSAGTTGPSLMGVATSIAAEKENLNHIKPTAKSSRSEELQKPDMSNNSSNSSAVKKPRISRSKIKERLGTTQRARSPFSPGPGSGSGRNDGGSGTPSPKKRVSSPRKSAGGAKARGSTGAGASGVLMSAKKRARASEARSRKSTKMPASANTSPARNGRAEMDVDA